MKFSVLRQRAGDRRLEQRPSAVRVDRTSPHRRRTTRSAPAPRRDAAAAARRVGQERVRVLAGSLGSWRTRCRCGSKSPGPRAPRRGSAPKPSGSARSDRPSRTGRSPSSPGAVRRVRTTGCPPAAPTRHVEARLDRDAPGTLSTTIGWSRSGMFSLKFVNVALGTRCTATASVGERETDATAGTPARAVRSRDRAARRR